MSLSDTLSLKSVYSLRLYEMLKSSYDYQNYLKKADGVQILDYNLTELKLELGIINSGGSKEIKSELEKEYPDYDRIDELVEKTGQQIKYKEYKIFNRNVLNKAKEELNKKTSLNVDYEPIKKGRRTVGIRFVVSKKDTNVTGKPVNINKEEVLDELIDLLHADFKFKEIQEIAEFAGYDLDKIKKSYEYMKEYGTQIDVPIAFFKDCIKKEYYQSKKSPIKPSNNSFNNFEQRTGYDFDELEKQLLDN